MAGGNEVQEAIAAGGDSIAITGYGLVTAAGRGAEAFWRALRDRRGLLGPLRQIESEGLAMARGGEVPDAALDGIEGLPPGSDRALRLAAPAIEEALGRAGLDPGAAGAPAVGLALGTALGAVQALERIAAGGADSWSAVPQHLLARALAERYRLGGPRWTFSVTCVSGLYALEQAAADLRRGRAGAMVCGGLDTLSRFMQSGFCALRALSPTGSLRPFDRGHDGIVLGEGAAFLVLEPLARARARGARPLAVIAGNRLIGDAVHLTSPDEAGRGMARAIEEALLESGLPWDAIGCLTPTAAGSPVYDRMQSRAAFAALGERAGRIAATTWEPAVGHLLAATGIAGLVHAAMAIERGEALPAFGVEEIDPECHLRYLLERAEPLSGKAVIALTVGFGGQNGATVVAPPTLRAAPAALAGPPRALLASAAMAGRLAVPGGAGERDLSWPGDAAGKFDPGALAELFPGRWNPRRALPRGLEPLAAAFAAALERAGWWRPRQAEPVAGGLVLGTDYQGITTSIDYARELARAGPAGISPTGFLFSLPSSAAAVLGVLLGLPEYQATITGGGGSGFQAMAHAIDLLAAGRIDRLAAGALTVAAPESAAVLAALGYRAGEGPGIGDTDRGGPHGEVRDGGEAGRLEMAVALCLERAPERPLPGACLISLAGEAAAGDRAPGRGAADPSEHLPEILAAAELGDFPPAFRALAAPSLAALLRAARRGPGPHRLAHRDPTDAPPPPLIISGPLPGR